ncbi:MAG TPA: FG-GAP-like repeat-containing protein [Candidatus Acidoferrum sp.]|nr:FG-GAP-like repeat-containing protein [Candidatus Acidoferrum sp.]
MNTSHPNSALTSLRSLPLVPPLTLAAVLVCLAPGAQAQLPNAWQINDDATNAMLYYYTNLSTVAQQAATNRPGGFDFTINARFVRDFSNPGSLTIIAIYGDGSKRWEILWSLDSNGNLMSTLYGGNTYPVTTDGTGTSLYHTYQISYNPTNGLASFLVDGQVLTTNWAGNTLGWTAGELAWGALSSGGVGAMNFHSVSFDINGLGAVAAYDAGTENNPAHAPDPASQGWVLSPSTPPSGTSTNALSPDNPLLPSLVTLAANGFTTNSAVLNGLVNPSGSATAAWFEWGTSTSYGHLTAAQAVGAGASDVGVSKVVSGLVAGLDYHYRVGASNAFGTILGGDQSFPIPSFFPQTIPGLPGVNLCSVAWGDYDHDGRLDILVAGQDTHGNLITEVWRNTGSGFANINAGLPGVYYCSVAWGDYDNDGNLDILLAGLDINYNLITQVWRNTGSGFTNINAGLPGAFYCSVAWGDYDNDGRLDILLAGDGPNGPITEVWRNTGSGFTNINAGLPGLYNCSVTWGDYDHDGRLDILLAGQDAHGNLITQVWRNTGSGFTNINAGLPGVYYCSAAWGDYDNDGQLDILLAGDGPNGRITEVWRNNAQFSNAPPAAPTGLSGAVSGATVTLNWTTPTDDHTPAAGLNYNARIGTKPGASDVLSPMALTNGLRLLPARGNAQAGTYALYSLPQLTSGRDYYWSVQAVDSSFAGSPFAAEGSFTIGPRLINPIQYSSGVFEFYYTNRSVLVPNYEVLASTNLALPVVDWTRLGSAIPLGNGLYRFTDIGAIGQPQRFYQLVSP